MLDSLPDSVSSMAPSSQILFIPQALIQMSLQDAFVDCLRILGASLSSHRTSHSNSIYHIWLSTLISLWRKFLSTRTRSWAHLYLWPLPISLCSPYSSHPLLTILYRVTLIFFQILGHMKLFPIWENWHIFFSLHIMFLPSIPTMLTSFLAFMPLHICHLKFFISTLFKESRSHSSFISIWISWMFPW